MSASINSGNQARRLIAVGDVPRVYGIPRATLYELMNSRKVAAVKLGRRTLIDVASLDTFVAGLPAYTEAKGPTPRHQVQAA